MKIALFDLNGTLTDPAPLGAPWGRTELGERILGLAVRGGMVDALTTASRPFTEHLRAAAEVLCDVEGLDPTRIEDMLAAATALPARPDVAEALELLRDAGVRVAVLTNSGADSGASTLEAAGVRELVGDVLGVDGAGTFKPHPATYRHALDGLAAQPGDVVMVAAHPWDLSGAAAVGLRTAWVAHGRTAYPSTAASPDVRGATLTEVAREVAQLAPRVGQSAT